MVWRMITYLYKLDYDDSQVFLPGGLSNEEVANTPLLVNVIMYTMGDKYGIGGLKKVAETKFDEAVTGLTSPLDFLLVVAEVYESTPEEDRGLRDVAVRHAILNHKGLAISKKFRAVVAKVPQFACDIIAWKSEKATKPVTRFLTQCRGCHKTTYGKIEKLRCEDCNFLKSASTLDNIWCLN